MEISPKYFTCFILGLLAISMYLGAYQGIVRRAAYAHGSYSLLDEGQSLHRGYWYLAGAVGTTIAVGLIAKFAEDGDD